MVLLQHKLNLKVSQKQILTPGLVQMVSVLALNKLELKDMINEEMVENPVLDEYLESVPTLDEVSAKEEERERLSSETEAPADKKENDPFDQIDFGEYFRDYLDPGYRSSSEMESLEKPSFENFLSKPTTLTDHLMWQLGAMHLTEDVRAAAELVIGNLNEEGYLIASDDELIVMASYDRATQVQPGQQAEAAPTSAPIGQMESEPAARDFSDLGLDDELSEPVTEEIGSPAAPEPIFAATADTAETALADAAEEEPATRPMLVPKSDEPSRATFGRDALQEAIDIVRQMDPVGVACRTLPECLLAQLEHLRQQAPQRRNGSDPSGLELIEDAIAILRDHIKLLQNKAHKELGKALNRPVERIMQACDLLKTLDPKPGLRYNKVEARLIEPDVAVIKQGDEYFAFMNDDDLPQLRLNPTYKKLLGRESAEKDVRNYVKERYKSAIQLIKNIEQRKQTILKVCYAIIGRQREFLDFGIDYLKPMMIKEVAEEIGVHPSTVSRAVANKYAHTPQGVFELRYFFSESVNGPEGGGTSLLILKRRVKKLIEDEDPARPLTDEQITRILQSQGIQVTRRTVAKYREDMKIPSTHQRRVKN